MVTAIGLLSGGLDSILAVKVMGAQDIEIRAVHFAIPFCTGTPEASADRLRRLAELLNVRLEIVELGDDFVELVKHPRHGWGRNMNPCVDCKIFMLGRARRIMDETGAACVFTGEVLGERPMSQMRDTLRVIERESGLTGRLVRPLSAKLLPPTIPEQEGLIDREKLLAFSGRSRKPQFALARQFGILEYPQPAGGCKLTDPQYSRRLREAFDHSEDGLSDIRLLSVGRHFRLESGVKVIVGRNEEENRLLETKGGEGDLLLEVDGVTGPVVVVQGGKKIPAALDIQTAAGLCVRYSDYKQSEPARVNVIAPKSIATGAGGAPALPVAPVFAAPLADDLVEKLRIR